MSEPVRLTGQPDKIQEFLDKFDTFLFDCDGVLWSGDQVFEGTLPTLKLLRGKGKRVLQVPVPTLISTQGKKIVFVTNNSTKSRADYCAKLTSMGVEASESEIFGSSYSASLYIARILDLPSDKRTVFALGESGMETELRSFGLKVIGGTDASLRRDITPEDFSRIADGSALDPSVGCVLAGLDFHVNYLKLAHAGAYLMRGAHFLATNTDSTLPMSGKLFLGAGSVGAPLAKMMGREPLAFGKPSQAMMDAIEGGVAFERSRTCMVGDRLDTDIRFGNDGHLGGTLLVLTGVSKMGEWGEDKGMRPAYVADKLGDLCG